MARLCTNSRVYITIIHGGISHYSSVCSYRVNISAASHVNDYHTLSRTSLSSHPKRCAVFPRIHSLERCDGYYFCKLRPRPLFLCPTTFAPPIRNVIMATTWLAKVTCRVLSSSFERHSPSLGLIIRAVSSLTSSGHDTSGRTGEHVQRRRVKPSNSRTPWLGKGSAHSLCKLFVYLYGHSQRLEGSC